MPPGGVGPGRPVADGVNGLSHAKHAFACVGGERESMHSVSGVLKRVYRVLSDLLIACFVCLAEMLTISITISMFGRSNTDVYGKKMLRWGNIVHFDCPI